MRRAARVGAAIAFACRIGGWFVPMYGAGRLESGNVREYETAARLAWWAGRGEYVDDLLRMAETEWEHELYFRAKVGSHPLRRVFPAWTIPPPKGEIRATFERCVSSRSHSPSESVDSRDPALGSRAFTTTRGR